MFDNRALKLDIIQKPGVIEEPRVIVHIYADDDCSPVAQVYAIPLSRIRIALKDSFDAIYSLEEWSLQTLLREKLSS